MGKLMVRHMSWVFFCLKLTLVCDQRRRGIEARRKSIAPVGAWFSQIGRLHQVHHMWQYPWEIYVYVFFFFAMRLIRVSLDRNLQKRRDIREKAWQNDGWAETVSKAKIFPCLERYDVMTLFSLDGTTGTDYGCFYSYATVVQSSEIRYLYHPQLAMLYVAVPLSNHKIMADGVIKIDNQSRMAR